MEAQKDGKQGGFCSSPALVLSPGGKIFFPPSARAAKMKWAFLDQVAWESNYIFSFGCSMSLQKLVPKMNVLIDPKKAM